MSAPLSNKQKAYLAQLANQAFEKRHGDGRTDTSDISRSMKMERYRHDEVAKACGKLGLRCCTQDDYGAVKGHFLALLGKEGQALRADVKGRPELNQLRVVQWKIVNLCKEMGRSLGYAEAICMQMNRGKGLQEVEEARTLWKVFYALNKQAQKERQAA